MTRFRLMIAVAIALATVALPPPAAQADTITGQGTTSGNRYRGGDPARGGVYIATGVQVNRDWAGTITKVRGAGRITKISGVKAIQVDRVALGTATSGIASNAIPANAGTGTSVISYTNWVAVAPLSCTNYRVRTNYSVRWTDGALSRFSVLSPLTQVCGPDLSPALAIRRGPTSSRAVVLTFDAGSDTGSAAQILDVLATNNIRATFGLTGKWADANPGLVRRMANEGHQLINHTYDHPSFTGFSTSQPPLTRTQRIDQLNRAEAAVRRAAGVSMAPWFRPPYGDEDASVRADVGSAGYRYELMWTVDSLGWQGGASSEVVQRCLSRAEPGAIYLFHVGSASTDAEALQRIIDGLVEGGYGFKTAASLMEG